MQVKVALPSLFKTYTFKIIGMRKKIGTESYEKNMSREFTAIIESQDNF